MAIAIIDYLVDLSLTSTAHVSHHLVHHGPPEAQGVDQEQVQEEQPQEDGGTDGRGQEVDGDVAVGEELPGQVGDVLLGEDLASLLGNQLAKPFHHPS